MALFVEGPASTIDDLTDQDAGLLDVAVSAGINVSTKLRLAMEEIRTDLTLWLSSRWEACELVWDPALRIEQVVVTPPLKRWETIHALALIYRDAYFSQLVDRYQAKWQEYAKLTREVRDSVIASGLGVVHDPLPKAPLPILSTKPGPQAGGTFYARITWVNAAGQEGTPSAASSLVVADGNLMTVGTGTAPNNATGFNVYAGTSLDATFLQNNFAVGVADSFLFVPGQVAHGTLPGNGQPPDYRRRLARTILRG
ncbi:MAG TPA: hypothetical protein VN519_11510 [Bryobacteraceae bacterium]|nr:hypothetical protein [Bryobacteraceae bacterium]